MIRTVDFNARATGEIVTNQFDDIGLTVSATSQGTGSDQAMIFDTNNPTGGHDDLATGNLDNVLIISADGDASDPESNAEGGTITFAFDEAVAVKSLTFLDLEEPAIMRFFGEDGTLLSQQTVLPTGDNGQSVVQLFVPGTVRFEIDLPETAAVDNLVFEDNTPDVVDGIVSGGATNDIIGLNYEGDPDGDRVDAGDAVIAGEAADDDIVDALGGDDTVVSLEGDDDVYAGSGDDEVAGGAGNDLIFGDSTLAENDTVASVDETRESFNWSHAGVDGGSPLATEFTQDTGSVNVTFTNLGGVESADTSFSTDTQRVEGIESENEAVNPNSSLSSETGADGQSQAYQLSFDTEVCNVDFNINDIDGDSAVRVLAYDADGNQVDVTLVAGGGLALSDSDGVAGNDTAQADGDFSTAEDAFSSLQVDIVGPVARIEILHEQNGSGNTDINVSDVFFTAGGTAADVHGGDDALSGDEGDDTIFGQGGDDTLTGGEGADSLLGGNDADLFIGGDDGDVVDGGTGGNDYDTLDLSDSGPLRVENEILDADGNSTSGTVEFLNGDGSVSGSLAFTEIEELILPSDDGGTDANQAPIASDDLLTVFEDRSRDINVLENDVDPDLDPLSVTDASSPDGEVTISPEGILRFTPNEDFNGETVINYTISDGNGGFDDAQVQVTVDALNDAPILEDDTAQTALNTNVIIPILANDSDPDGDLLTVTSATSPNGSVGINDDGTLSFTPSEGFTGSAEIIYVVSDGNGGAAAATVNVSVSDGIVMGTDGDDNIDTGYIGDPDGDLVDNGDAVLPGEAPQDDIIIAGDGNDTVEAGEGADEVNGGEGDDVINTGSSAPLPDLAYPGVFAEDSDPEDDRDSVDGGAGDDTISTGDDRDTITGGSGDDVIDAGIDDDDISGGGGDDRIVGAEGNDNITGGAGNDTIYANNDPDLGLDFLEIEDDGSNVLGPDLEPNNGDDTVDGGAGNDLIFGGDDNDHLMGGSGNDSLDGGIDDDSLGGGSGEDLLIGGQGNDTLRGNNENDTLFGDAGDDLLDGGQNDDVLNGGDGDDTIEGALGDDTLNGDEGDDSIIGGSGNDIIDGGAGNDFMTGGADRDEFLNVNAGDVVDGSESGDDFDCLDLTGSAPAGGSLEVVLSDDNAENGVVNYFNADGSDAGQLVFTNIEKVVPCFTPGTLIATPKGERKVEDLNVGDRIITRDNGLQVIRWVGARDMSGEELAIDEHLRPVLIREGALGKGLPERDMMVSPQHRVLVANDKTALYFGEREVLVAAKHLTDMDGVDVVEVSHTCYIHIMFDQHEVILSDGCWTESFQPGDLSLAGVGDESREEILELFPELATHEGVKAYASARKSLKKHEAKLVTG